MRKPAKKDVVFGDSETGILVLQITFIAIFVKVSTN
jgi:hypothetical protein